MAAMHRCLEKWLAKAIASQAKYYNSKHVAREYNVGNLVYLNNKNIDSIHPTKKLDWRLYGPYTVIDRVDKVCIPPRPIRINEDTQCISCIFTQTVRPI